MNENAFPDFLIKNGDYPLSCQFSAGVKQHVGKCMPLRYVDPVGIPFLSIQTILGATIQSVDYPFIWFLPISQSRKFIAADYKMGPYDRYKRNYIPYKRTCKHLPRVIWPLLRVEFFWAPTPNRSLKKTHLKTKIDTNHGSSTYPALKYAPKK